jgi:hypothetical protein
VEQQQSWAAGGGELIVVAAGRALKFALAAAGVLPVVDRAREIPVGDRSRRAKEPVFQDVDRLPFGSGTAINSPA